jgi:heme/copper-type cytochrome/quinol oxidase subunit 4
MSIGKPFRYLFFAIYLWNERHGIAGKLVVNAVVGVAFLLGMNVLVGLQLMLFFHVDNYATQMLALNARLTAIIVFIPLCGVLWQLFVANGSYKQFGKEFATTSERRIRMRRLIFTTYVVVTICAPLFVRALINNAPG